MKIRLAQVITALLVGLVIGSYDTDHQGKVGVGQACPTEDSCKVDYRDGRYHIDRVTP